MAAYKAENQLFESGNQNLANELAARGYTKDLSEAERQQMLQFAQLADQSKQEENAAKPRVIAVKPVACGWDRGKRKLFIGSGAIEKSLPSAGHYCDVRNVLSDGQGRDERMFFFKTEDGRWRVYFLDEYANGAQLPTFSKIGSQ
ncbi:MAG: hypothetical protein ACKVS5_05075 [Parvularculaceae bacterium]